jgi:tetratricopeptide (TPR) repeat protein
MSRHLSSIVAFLATAYAIGAVQILSAAEVRVGLSVRETYVRLPVTLRIQVANATKVDPPTLPTIDGLAIKSLGNPSRSTQITTINGHTTTSTTLVFAFELTPQRTGTFQIPAVTINADGVAEHTRPVEIVASKSETGDLMFVEIAGKEKQIYVGQALHLTLKMWLRPYSDAKNKITLSEADMWKMISDRSEWGPFAERMQLYGDQNRRPAGKEVLRKDRDGVEHSYYLYEIEATIYPKRPGKIDGDDVKLIADYPTALGRARDPLAGFFDDMQFPGGRPGGFGDDDGFSLFGSRLVVQSVRPLAAQADVGPINVLPIPTAGRPADYRGAVGTYHIAVDANPTHVKAGDPINLFVGISGTGPMELVQAPPLAEIPELTADFKAPAEPLAGFVKGDRKIFSTTIRPRKQGSTRIPPIPFSYFDPAAAKFVTVHSDPISIQVDPAEMLALDRGTPGPNDKESASHPGQQAPSDLSSTPLAVFTGEDLLISESPWSPNRALWILLFAIPPIAVLMILALRSRAGLSSYSRWFRSANSQLQKELTNAGSASEIGAALKRFAARHYKQCDPDAESIVGIMRTSGADELATRFETLLNECGDDFRPAELQQDHSLVALKHRAQQWATDVQSFRRRAVPRPKQRPVATSKPLRSASAAQTTSLVVLAFVATSFALLSVRPAAAEAPVTTSAMPAIGSAPISLNEQQQRTVLDDATNAYSKALGELKQDPAGAKLDFEEAAEKYQLLADAGIENSRLYCNLANAYLESGQIGKAIANYHRSLRIDPTFRAAQTNLTQAEQQLHPSTNGQAQQSSYERSGRFSAAVTSLLTQNLTPRQMLAAMALAWFAFWAVIAFRLFGYSFPWKSSAFVLALAATLLGMSLTQIWPASAQRLAVVIQSNPANSTNSDAQISDGQVVEILQQRPDAVRIRTADGQEMWLPAIAVDLI